MGTCYGQLTESERCEIFRLHAAGISGSEIGRMIGRNKGTISRELRRNALPKAGYLPLSAERMALAKRHRKRKSKIERSSDLLEAVRNGLFAMGRSPEQIAGLLEREKGKPAISVESIYRFAHGPAGRKEGLHRYLPQAKARRGRRARRNGNPLIPHRVSIHDRPPEIENRQSFGHWEGDLMAFSKPGANNVVLVERKSRYLLLARQPDKTAQTTTASMERLFSLLPKEARRSVTFDNGGEFAQHTALGVPTYFCDPHSPWQKGSVENAIGRLRRDLPRSTKPSDHTEADLQDIIDTYNHTPRKCLGFLSPAQAILSNLYNLRCT